MEATQDRFLTDSTGFVRPLLTISTASILACAPVSQGATSRLIDHLNEKNSVGSGASASWLCDAMGSLDELEDYEDLVIQYQQGASESHRTPSASEPRMADGGEEHDLLHIKHVFSLNALQLAAIMGVSRSAFYKWLDGSSQMRPDKFERLQALKALAERWHSKSDKAIARTRGVSRESRMSVVQALESTEVDWISRAENIVDGLLAEVMPKQPTRKRVTEIAKERGWKPLPEDVAEAQLRNTIPRVRLGGEDQEQ